MQPLPCAQSKKRCNSAVSGSVGLKDPKHKGLGFRESKIRKKDLGCIAIYCEGIRSKETLSSGPWGICFSSVSGFRSRRVCP